MRDGAQRRQDYMPGPRDFLFPPPFHKNNLSIALKSRYWLAQRLWECPHLISRLWETPASQRLSIKITNSSFQMHVLSWTCDKNTLHFFPPNVSKGKFVKVQLWAQCVETRGWTQTVEEAQLSGVISSVTAACGSHCEAAEWQLSFTR